MVDVGANYTDEELKKFEKKINTVYKQAGADITKKIKDFNEKYKIKEEKHLKELADGKITQEQFDSWKKGQVFQGKQWEEKKKQITSVLSNANQIATDIMNGHMAGVFASGANFMSYQLENGTGVNFGFGLYDSATIANLLKNDPKLLPPKKISPIKDNLWNQKKISRQITLGIIQGEKLDDIAKRLGDVLGTQNKNSMLTYARTSMTGAQNAGREYSLGEAKKLGIDVEKEWMCTLDGHTRTLHRLLDGQRVPIDKPFEISGYKIRYPGDAQAAGILVWNCRCTMVGDVKNYPSTYDRYDNIDGKPIKNMTYEEWEKAKKKGDDISPVPLTWKKFVEKGNAPKSKDLVGQFTGKKMSNVYNDMKNVDSNMANKFYKELQGMGKPSDIWNQYINGTLDPKSAEKIDAILKSYLQKASKTSTAVGDITKITKDATKKTKAANNLEEAQKALKEAQEAINKSGAGKVFTGIWKDPVTYADYDAKAGSIAAKKKYYEEQIAKYSKPVYANSPWASDEIKKCKEHLAQLEEFEKNGKAYSQLYKNLDEAKKKVKLFTPSSGQFASDAFSDATKQSARSFTDKKAADKFHRQHLDKIWDNLDDKEKYSVWEYTRNSNPMNKPLSGYHDSWSRSDFVGPGKTDWGHEDSWRSLPSAFKKYGENGHVTYHSTITSTTRAIEKSTLPDGVMLVRGSDSNGFAGMIEGDLFSFDDVKKLLDKGNLKDIKSALEGQVIQNHAFTSTGIATGTGFGGEISYKIYAPKGTKAIYAEPQSYFGSTVGSNAKLYKKGQAYSNVGGEAEVILQRGTKFRITNITESGRGYTVEMEVVEQPKYFKFGDEDTFNNGLTRHKK